MSKSNKKNSNVLKKVMIVIAFILMLILIILILKSCNKGYDVVFESNGGTYVEGLVITKDGKIKKPSDPKKEGYVFEGWYLNGKLFDFNTKIDKDIKLVAKWSKIGISFNNKKMYVLVGKTQKVNAILKGDIKLDDLKYNISDDTIATVDSNGVITGVKEGIVTLTVATKDGKYKSELKVEVTKDKVAVTGVTITGNSSVIVGNTIKLNAKIEPEEATNNNVSWNSSDTSIATIDKDGYLRGLRSGTVTITVKTEDGSYTAEKIIKIESESIQSSSVSSNSETQTPTTEATTIKTTATTTKKTTTTTTTTTTKKIIHVENVSISGERVVVEGGGYITLFANITPNNATNKNVIWTSNNTNIATVNSNGVVTGIKAGNVTITATTQDGNKKATYDIVVKEKPGKYVITFTGIQTTTGVFNYRFSLTRNGIAFTGYDWITIGDYGNPFPSGELVLASTVNNYIKGKSSATISITDPKYINIDGSSVTASIVIN